MVCVFPEPVTPYMKSSELQPDTSSLTNGRPTSLNTAF